MDGGGLRRPRLLTINFILKKSSKYIEKHIKNVKIWKIYKIWEGGGIDYTWGLSEASLSETSLGYSSIPNPNIIPIYT